MQVDLAAAFSDRADDWPNALLDALPGADEGAWAIAVDLSGWGVTVTRRARRPGVRLRRDIYRPPSRREKGCGVKLTFGDWSND